MNWNDFGIEQKYQDLDAAVMNACRPTFETIEEIRDFNQIKVLNAFIDCRVGAEHMLGSTGYGYGDIGRDMLDKVFARAVGAEDALCRMQFMSGTHAITVALFGLLRGGMTMLSVTGTPYDTIQTALGLKTKGMGSLDEYGVSYREIALLNNNPDYDKIEKEAAHADLVYIQRSRGYGYRRALTLEDIKKISDTVRNRNKDAMVVVDNCYGEFTNTTEPLQHGADVIIGSLIKNPGGGIAETGGYIAGRKDLIERCSYRLTAPGVGREIGSYPHGYRTTYLGIYMAPQITAEALKSAVYASELFERLGFEVDPKTDAKRDDIITTVKLKSAENLSLLCRAIQSSSPVDSFATPEGSDMPGYDSKVIMAAGAFTNGSSIELSADAPIREPYRAFIQGGLNLAASRYAFLRAATLLDKEN